MIISGLFSFESDTAYLKGNSTYLSLPLACILSFGVFLLCSYAMSKTGASDLKMLFVNSYGQGLGIIMCFIITIIMIANTCVLLNKFLNVMNSYFFQEASYYAIMFYMIVVIAAFGIMGFETINRTSKIIGVILLLMLILLFLNSASGYQTYKMYPIAGDGAKNMLSFSFCSTLFFLPAIISALITSKGMHGIVNARKNVINAAIIAIIICGVSQFLLALSFTYDELSTLYMPLYRMSMITGDENFIVRIDKLSGFAWLIGALLSCSLYVYSSSLLFCRSFRQNDIRPTVLGITLVSGLICILSHSGKHMTFDFLKYINKYGTIITLIPLILASLLALLKKNAQTQKQKKAG